MRALFWSVLLDFGLSSLGLYGCKTMISEVISIDDNIVFDALSLLTFHLVA